MARIRATVALCVALLAGCGGGDKHEPAQVDPARLGDLIARIPASERSAVALDVARARAELGLAADAAPPAPETQGNDGQRRLRALVAATVLNYPIRDNGPLDRAVDAHRVTGLVRVDGPPEVLMIATREPWAELKRALGREGWHARRDGVLERPLDPDTRVLRWVAGRDGLAVATGDPSLAPRVLAGHGPTSGELRALLAGVSGPARAARVVASRCVKGLAAGYSPAAAEGQFAVAVADVPPLPYRLVRPRGARLPAGYQLGKPVAAGGRVQVPFGFEASTDPTVQPGALALVGLDLFTYRC